MHRTIYSTLVFFLYIGLATSCTLTDSVDDALASPRQAATLATIPPINSSHGESPLSTDRSGFYDKWSLWVNGTQLRGANIYQRRVYPELDGPEFMGSGPVGPPYTQEDFDELAALGANYVNISQPGLYTESPPYMLDPIIQTNLDNLLAMIAKANMFAVISFRTGPGRSEFTFFWDEVGDWFDECYLNDSVWGDQSAQNAWSEMWRYSAQRYRGNSVVVGYDLMVEPNSNEVGSHALYDNLDIWDPEEFYNEYGGTLYDWNQLYPEITSAIREVDQETPILIGGLGYSASDWLPYLQPTGDPRTVYTAHQYAPTIYTHQDWNETGYNYPGTFDTDWDGIEDQFNRFWLENRLSTVGDYIVSNNVPVAVNEFGVVRWAPSAADFMDDQIDLIESQGINHSLWVWDPAWEPWTSKINYFNFRFGADHQNHSQVPNDLMNVIASYWHRNIMRPFSTGNKNSYLPLVTQTSRTKTLNPLPLPEVKYWAYQLQDIDLDGALDALTDSHYDMLVLEPTRTDWSSDAKFFDTRRMVSRLKNSKANDESHRKLVIAYIDIGEAEDLRWYWTWSKDWNCTGDPPSDWPTYILSCDPDGWEGNYPVAYWDPSWKDIIIYGQNNGTEPARDYTSVIDEVIKDGFDGIYLDWVEGFENDSIISKAQIDKVDPAVEMIKFIQEMRDYTTTRNPNFIIIQQNAASLVDDQSDLPNLIDAISQEAIWYDGDATDDWGASDGYNWVNDVELTNYYIDYMQIYLDAGIPVFNCEYALNIPADNIYYADQAYTDSNAKGYVPYATRRSLSKLSTTPPPDY